MTDKPHHERGADDKAHGTHGKGDSREQRVDDVAPAPATADAGRLREAANTGSLDPDKLKGQLGDASWGDAGSGGSTIDKRSPKKG